jgi:predicted metal-binding protein
VDIRRRFFQVTKIGIIRCNEWSNSCAGFTCFPSMAKKSGEFARYDTIELVAKAMRLKEKGAEVIHLGDCMIGACPNKDKNIAALKEQVGLPIVERTHGPAQHK